MKLDLGKIKAGIVTVPTKLIPKRKKKAKLTDDEIEFIKENMESFRYYVKYEAVFKAFVKRVSDREIEALNKDKKCRFRGKSDVPFVVFCEVKEKSKMINECEDCTIRTEE